MKNYSIRDRRFLAVCCLCYILEAMALVLTAPPTAVYAAGTPTLVQWKSCPNSSNGNNVNANGFYRCQLPNPAQAGNLVVMGFTYSNSSALTYTVTDDVGDTLSLANSVFSSGQTQGEQLFYVSSVTAGAREFKFTTGTATPGTGSVTLAEYYNASTFDSSATSCNSNAGSSSITAGSITPSVSGDVIVLVSHTGNKVTSINPGSGFSMLVGDIEDGNDATAIGTNGSEYEVYNSTSATNPGMTLASSHSWLACAAAFEATSTGSADPRSGIRVQSIQAQNLANSTVTTWTLQWNNSGCSGTGCLLVVAAAQGASSYISSMSDGQSNTWTSIGTAGNCFNSTEMASGYYAKNATTSQTDSVTINLSVGEQGGFVYFYVIQNASSNPFDAQVCENGDETSSGSSTLQVCSSCITLSGPATNEVVIPFTSTNAGTFTGLTGSNQYFQSCRYDGEDGSNPETACEQNGWGVCYVSNASCTSFTWNKDNTNASLNWATIVVAFEGNSLTGSAVRSGKSFMAGKAIF